MPAGLTGNTHRDTMNIRHGEHRKEAIDQIRGLRSRLEKMDVKGIGAELDAIFKTLDYKLS